VRLMRAAIIVAVVAALSGAPSSVSAAANQLTSPQVSPGSGSVTTVFTFRVRYDGAFAATSVSVAVAGLSLPMVLQSGSPTAGWWTTASVLPVGAWSTTFSSTAARGPAATVQGPAVVVAAPATAPPASAIPTTPSGGATPESVPIGGSGDGTAATPAPDAAPDGATASSGPTSAPGDGLSAPEPAPDGGTDPAPGGGTETDPDAGTAENGGDEPPADDGAPAASGGRGPSPADGATRARTPGDTTSGEGTAAADDLVSTLLLIGLAGVASVAVIGTLLLMAGRRREPQRATAAASAPVGAAAVRPRIARRASTSPADDPIVAALGVDDEMAARRAIRRARATRVSDDPPAGRPRRR
jgi:hypothetical protein